MHLLRTLAVNGEDQPHDDAAGPQLRLHAFAKCTLQRARAFLRSTARSMARTYCMCVSACDGLAADHPSLLLGHAGGSALWRAAQLQIPHACPCGPQLRPQHAAPSSWNSWITSAVTISTLASSSTS